MARTGALVTFDEFRALWAAGAGLRATTAERVLAGRDARRRGWVEWPDGLEAETMLERARSKRGDWIPWGDAR